MIKKDKKKFDIHLDYLNKLLSLYSTLFSFSKKQMTALSSNNYINLEKSINEKDKCIEKIRILDIKFKEIQQRVKLDITKTNEKADLSNKISTIIKSTIKLDDESKIILASMKEESRNKFNGIIKGKKMLSGYYTGANSNVPKFLSRKG